MKSLQSYLKDETLLFNNLLLLGLDLIELKAKHKLDFQPNTFEILRINNQKITAHLIHFLLSIITESESDRRLVAFFPARTSSDYSSFKNEVYSILQNLDKQGKIPKNFMLSKAILEVFSGNELISFLRNLSEFTIRFVLNKKFPLEKIELFELNSEQKSIEISQIYELSSNMSENLLRKKIRKDSLSIAIKGCYLAIIKQRKKFLEHWRKFDRNTDIWSDIAKNFIEEFNLMKKKFNELTNENNLIKEKVPANFLKEFRALDRIQLIDLSRAFYKEMKRVSEEASAKNSIEKIEDFYQDSNENNLLNKITKENLGKKNEKMIDLDKVYEKWNVVLEKTKEEIPDEENVEKLLGRLREVAKKTNDGKERIAEMKRNYGKIKNKCFV